MDLFEYYNYLKVGKDVKVSVRCETDYLDDLKSLGDSLYINTTTIMRKIARYVYTGVDEFKKNSHYPLTLSGHNPCDFIRQLIINNEKNSVIAFKTNINNGDIRIVVLTKPYLLFVCFADHKELG